MDRAKFLIIFFSLLTAACAHSPPLFTSVTFLPAIAEPAHKDFAYSNLPRDIVMQVRMSSSDVVALVENEFADKFAKQQITFEPVGDTLVISNKSFFRRVDIMLVAYGSNDIHPACRQEVLVWFNPDGIHVGTYVQEVLCPI